MQKNTAQAEKYRAKPLTSQQTQTTMNTEANRKTEWVVGIGEALWDILPEGRKIGGAPANFAYHMSQFGLRSCAVSAVGDDEAGRELRNQLREKGVGHMLETVPFPTGTVEVTLDGGGHPQLRDPAGRSLGQHPVHPADRGARPAHPCSLLRVAGTAQPRIAPHDRAFPGNDARRRGTIARSSTSTCGSTSTRSRWSKSRCESATS